MKQNKENNMNQMHIVGISGSLRKGSYNTALLTAAQSLLPDSTTFEIAEIGNLPFYNSDIDGDLRPDTIKQFRKTLSTADGLLFAVPEYNYSFPGVFKNAIDWASRGKDSPLLNKPVGLMGATNGMWGTARMQQSIRPIFQAMNMFPVNKPEVYVSQAKDKFDEKGMLIDEKTKEIIRQHLQVLKDLMIQLNNRTRGWSLSIRTIQMVRLSFIGNLMSVFILAIVHDNYLVPLLQNILVFNHPSTRAANRSSWD